MLKSAPDQSPQTGPPPRLARSGRWERLPGISDSVRQLEAAIVRVSDFECSTLVTGETGCGKEEVARAIHAAGPRRNGPFVTVNCGGLPNAIAESQLFGHERGAFTGAIGTTRGAFRASNGGVIFLDEIGEMPMEMQPKLLRVLERREVVPVGSSIPEPIDVQVISATNRDLQEEVERGGFREDLLFRINTIHLKVPPLRERPEDIPGFIQHFSAYYAARYGRTPWEPSPEMLARLVAHDWPGNVRELAQTIQRLYVFHDSADRVLDELLGLARLGAESYAAAAEPSSQPLDAVPASPAADPAEPVTFNLREIRRRTVRAALAATDGHFAKAAKLLGVCPNTMTKLVAEAFPEMSAARVRRPRQPR